ncbi:MAG TPA: hypothetical protein VGL93_17375 [Streptosporangiaceae bacterium]
MTDESPPRLPTRNRTARPSGRHRRGQTSDLPPEAPALVPVMPAGPAAGDDLAKTMADTIADELPGVMADAYPGLDIHVARLGGPGDPGDLDEILAAVSAARPGAPAAAVVAPLITGPYPEFTDAVRAVTGDRGVVTGPLGPHPLLAQALHERLAASGLARPDRVRMLGLVTAADGVIVATAGGGEAVRAADMTAVLLASRLAVPVVPASLNGSLQVSAVADRMRETGAARIAVAPYVIGPEADLGRMNAEARNAGAECAAPIGAHPAVARLLSLGYEMALDELRIGYMDT